MRHATLTLAEVRRWLASLQGRPDGAPLCDELQALALRTSARSLFSVDLGVRDEALLAILTDFTELISAGGFLDVILPCWLPTSLNRRRSELRDAWFSWIDRLAAERLAMPPSVGPDLVSVCLAAGEASGFRDAELRDQMSTFLIGATETTGYALRWAVYMLAAFPTIQETVAQEVEGADLDGTFADMRAGADAFRHLRAFLRETLRLYPPIKVLGRDATGPDLLGGVEVRKGDRIIVAPRARSVMAIGSGGGCAPAGGGHAQRLPVRATQSREHRQLDTFGPLQRGQIERLCTLALVEGVSVILGHLVAWVRGLDALSPCRARDYAMQMHSGRPRLSDR